MPNTNWKHWGRVVLTSATFFYSFLQKCFQGYFHQLPYVFFYLQRANHLTNCSHLKYTGDI